MNEISGKVRRWVHTALMVYSARALPLEKGRLIACSEGYLLCSAFSSSPNSFMADCRFSMISWASSSGAGRLSRSARDLSLDPENVQTGFVPGKNVLCRKAAPAAFGIFLAPAFLAIKAIFRMVAPDKILQICKGHGMLFEGKVHIGPQIIEPDFLGLAFRAGRTLIKEDHVCLYAGLVKNTGGKAENGVEITGLQQLFPDGFTSAAFEKHVVRHDHRCLAGRL